jgi:hypothetical protein
MKKLTATLILTFVCASGFAADSTEHHEGPCSKLMDACKAAGYTKANNKSLSKDCLQPLLNDEKVAGVKIDDSITKACKAKKAELKK